MTPVFPGGGRQSGSLTSPALAAGVQSLLGLWGNQGPRPKDPHPRGPQGSPDLWNRAGVLGCGPVGLGGSEEPGSCSGGQAGGVMGGSSAR